jgi:hypothetical protein
MAGGAATDLGDHAWSSIIPHIQQHELTSSLKQIRSYIDNNNSAVLQAEADKSSSPVVPQQMTSDQSWLSDLQVWAIGSRDIAVYFDVENKVATESTVTLNWDIEGWLATPKDKSIGEFPSSKTFKVVSSGDEITRARDSMIKLYGPDRLRWSSRLLEAKPIEEMWQKFMPVEPVS